MAGHRRVIRTLARTLRVAGRGCLAVLVNARLKHAAIEAAGSSTTMGGIVQGAAHGPGEARGVLELPLEAEATAAVEDHVGYHEIPESLTGISW